MTARKYSKVPFSEVEPIINLLCNNGFAEHEIEQAMGLTHGNIAVWRKAGEVRKPWKYALLGIASELGEKARGKPNGAAHFEYDEFALLFRALDSYRKALPGREAELKKLAARVSQEMVRTAS